MGINATSLAIVRNSDNLVETFVRLDVPDGWLPPDGYSAIPNDELPPDYQMIPETHDMNDVREMRNQKLKETDWTQTYDSPVNKEVWAIYRQALRDLPQNYNGDGPVPWPTLPE